MRLHSVETKNSTDSLSKAQLPEVVPQLILVVLVQKPGLHMTPQHEEGHVSYLR